MKRVTTKQERDFLKEYFQVDLYDTLLDSAFEAYHGRILVDNIDNPAILFVDVGQTFYYYGDPRSTDAKAFASLVEDYAEIHASAKWEKLFKEINQEKVHPLTRYEMDDEMISKIHLEKIINRMDKNLTIKEIDAALYDKVKSEHWTSSMVENFQDKEDFLTNGLGFVLVNDKGDILSGASSFTRYSEGYEVEIATHQDHRRKGYAYLIGAYFIKETMKRNLHAHWDAANIHSKALAEKLGYTLKRTYHIIEVY